MKTGLVLEGGGMRGLYTIGVLDAFMDAGVSFDYVVGVSAGACNGVSYLSGQRGRNLRIDLAYGSDKRYVSLRNFFKTGSMFGMDFIFDEIPHKLDLFDYDAFFANPCEFVTGVTDVETGGPVYFDKSHLRPNDCTILRASSAIPIFSPMVEYAGKKYLDGGTSDPIPVKKALEDGCSRVVVVLTQARDYIKKPESFRPVYRHLFRKFPAMVETLDHRYEAYNASTAFVRELEAQGRALVIAPDTSLGMSRFEHDPEKFKEVYARGLKDSQKQFDALREFLSAAV
ncbi:MAG: patatin family protein [Oscillospiraceae bacterium]|nr:patatin family protein [Oscillospiraceae bacterium]